jgi:hypothetical protein
MTPFTARWLAVGALGLGYGALRADTQDTAPTPEQLKRDKAQQAILNLSQNLNAPDVSEWAKAIVKEHHSEDISSVFKLKIRGGLGIGALTEAGFPQDGIERFIMLLSRRRTTSEAEIAKYQGEYLRVAKVMQAMAELAPHRATERVRKSPQLSKEWAEVVAEFKEGGANFRKAVEEQDPKKLRLAAAKMHNTCCHCHGLAD